LAVIPVGTYVKLVANEGNWCRVAYDGKVGYVRSIYAGLPSSISTTNPNNIHGSHNKGRHPSPNSDKTTRNSVGTGSITNNSKVREILRLTNLERKKRGLKPLILDANLYKIAQLHAEYMVRRHFFDHQNPNELTPFDRMNRAGISYFTAGENIAINHSPSVVVNAWMHSPGHRTNILNGSFGKIGISAHKGHYVQAFTN
jgi:uncharacterized protein YkwD